MLAEVCLAVHQFVLGAEDTPHQLLLLRGDGLEVVFLHLLELLYHLLIYLEVLGAVFSLVAEFPASQALERECA